MARTKQALMPSASGKPITKGKVTRKISKSVDKKPHRYRPGTVALREIRRYQKSVTLQFPMAPFSRLVKEITQDIVANVRYQRAAIEALQQASEMFLVEIFQKSNLNAIHGKRVTIKRGDMLLAQRLAQE